MNILIKKSIPNFITIANLFLGFTAIILLSLSINSDISYVNMACYLVLIGTVLDVLDGKIARKLNISSDFGKEIDSLADLVSFCMVPSFLIFVHYMVVLPELLNFKLLIVLSASPLVFGAIRLAKYNALREMRDSAEYLGLPTPSNAIFVCSAILFTYNIPYRSVIELDSSLYNFLSDFLEPFFITEYMVLLLSIFSSTLLLSKINYKKFPLISFRINKKNNIDLVKVIIFLLILGSSVVSRSYDIILLLFISFYIFGNFIKYFFNLIKR